MYQKIDRDNMFDAIWKFPNNLSDAIELGNNINLINDYNNISNIVIAGMGGSAIGGDVVSILEKSNINCPFFICRGYELPNWVNERTLVICSSYSGNTEETLAALEDGLKKKAQIIGITTGGELKVKLKALDKDVVLIPPGLQPRAALAFSFVPMIKILEKISIIRTNVNIWLEDAISTLRDCRKIYGVESMENPTFELAQQVYKNIPIIYADNSTYGIAAVRLKGQLCENGKMLSYYNDLPELNHNEIVGWENNTDYFEHLFVLWLTDQSDNHRVKHRQEITQEILNETGIDQFVVEMTGNSFQERFLHMINYGDWLSFWCAISHCTDPSPVLKIDRLKQELMQRQ